jgi:predicted ATPase
MVRRCPGLTVLTASQRPLDLAGERRLTLDPLPMPDAVELFVRRASAAAPGFAASLSTAGAIRSICAAVDGLPLAIELAAARMRTLTPAELAARLDRPLQVLVGGSRDAPDRHRSLRAAIESSLELLDDQARRLLAWLAPFAGGMRLSDLERVTDTLTGDHGWVLGAVSDLADTGLLRIRTDGTRSRYVLPDAVRQLADERLAARADDSAVRGAVARWYLHRLRAAGGTADGAGYTDVATELDNVRAAVDWAYTQDAASLDTATMQALYRFHDVHGRYGEGRTVLVRLAGAAAAGAPWALVGAGNFSRLLKDPDEAAELVARAETVMRPDDHGSRAAAELLLGNLAADLGNLPSAATHFAAAAHAARLAGDDHALGRALNNLGGIAVVLGDRSNAERYYRESLVVRRRAGAPDRDLGLTLMNLADLECTSRRWSAAIRHAREAAELLGRAGPARWQGMALSNLAIAALRGGDGGDFETAVAAIEEAVRLLPAFGEDRHTHTVIRARHSIVLHACGRSVGEVYPALADAIGKMTGTLAQFEIAPILEAHASLLSNRDAAAAARLLGLAEAVRDNQDHLLPSLLQPTEVTAAVCRNRLGAAAYAHEHRTGAALYRHGLPDALAELFHSAIDHQPAQRF